MVNNWVWLSSWEFRSINTFSRRRRLSPSLFAPLSLSDALTHSSAIHFNWSKLLQSIYQTIYIECRKKKPTEHNSYRAYTHTVNPIESEIARTLGFNSSLQIIQFYPRKLYPAPRSKYEIQWKCPNLTPYGVAHTYKCIIPTTAKRKILNDVWKYIESN